MILMIIHVQLGIYLPRLKPVQLLSVMITNTDRENSFTYLKQRSLMPSFKYFYYSLVAMPFAHTII